MTIDVKIGFIGAGNMAKAIGMGLIDSGIPASQLIVSAPSNRNLEYWTKVSANVTHNNNEVIDRSDVVFLSMKPQYLNSAANSLTNVPESKIYVSILAGISLDSLEKTLKEKGGPLKHFKIVRVMPNTPMLVRAGCSVMCANSHVTEAEVNLIKSIVSVCGCCEIIPETQLNSVAAVSGSGPAFIFMVIEALADGAVLQGVPRDLALKLAAKMVEGSGKLVAETGKHPGQLKDEVCSPGGMTIVGVQKLEECGVRNAFMSAVQVAAEKADFLATRFKK